MNSRQDGHPVPVEEEDLFLADWQADPRESRNLADDPAHAAVRDDSRARLAAFAARSIEPDFVPAYSPDEAPEFAPPRIGATIEPDSRAASRVSEARLWQRHMAMAAIGATPKGGNCRSASTALDGQGRDLVTGWMRDAGSTIRVDQVGNIFARRAGRNDASAPVMTGSHIDTQPTGGKFD
ncbi:hypothetical protein OY671_009327, partial [Metschnikowia pulcherrima]